METAIVALISTALIILSSVIMMTSTLQATSKMTSAWQAMNQAISDIHATSISAEMDDYTGGPINIRVHNDGQSNLYDFEKWDVIAQYESGAATYLEYTTSPAAGDNQWAIVSINIGLGQFELFDPGILNSGEYLSVQVVLDPPLETGQSARITFATPGGVKAQCLVTRKPPP